MSGKVLGAGEKAFSQRKEGADTCRKGTSEDSSFRKKRTKPIHTSFIPNKLAGR